VFAAAQDSSQSATTPQQPVATENNPNAPHAVQSPKPQRFELKDYTKPQGHFPNFIAPYLARTVPPPDLSNTPRIENLMRDGKLYISMDDAVALALENNLDIAIQRYNLNVADTDILRAKAGASILGVNSGVVQGTPGGGVGGLGGQVGSGQGGTTVAAGGAGTGAGGLVVSTLGSGPQITSFDPVLSGTLSLDRLRTICTSPFCGNNQNTASMNFSYAQGFHWGTNLLVGFNNTRVTSNSPFSIYSPTLNSNLKFQLTQHLMQGFGFAPNDRFIRIAKNNREISDVAFRLQVTTTVDQIENMYWDLVYAYENARVARESLAFAQKTLSDTQKQVQIGTLAPIEVVRSQSTVASDQQVLTVAMTNLQLQQLLMKNALSRTLVDPRLADAEVIPISTMELPATEPVVPTQDLVNDALNHRPELSQARINLTNTEISNKAVRNELRPSLDLFAYYTGTGTGGSQNQSYTCLNPASSGSAFCTDFAPAAAVGYGSTLNQLVNSSAPDKGIGLTLNIPLRNRAAQATQIRSELEYRQAQMRVQQLENQIRIEVRNAQFAVQQNRASVSSAQAAVALAQQSLDAEQKKYALGASTSTLVLQNQTALTQSETTLVSAMAAYEKSRLELDRATGLLLDHAGIQIPDAEKGEVTHMPNIPYVAPRKDVQSLTPQLTAVPAQAPAQTTAPAEPAPTQPQPEQPQTTPQPPAAQPQTAQPQAN
jgi:outer membrane protein TolC